MNKPMEVDIWQNDWGLPSIDLHCLEVLAYSKFSGVPLTTRISNNPFKSPSGTLPVFRHGKQVLTTFSEISAYLRKKNFSADFALSRKQCAEVAAYSQFLRDKLYPALQYIWWVDEKNYVELTRPWYAKHLPFPLNFYYPGRYERHAKQMMDCLYENVENQSVIETAVYGEAYKCITALSVRLGDADFFFGSHPTSLDATVYAYLAPLLKVPFRNPALQNHLKACTNLVKFVVRITQRYFPQTSQDPNVKTSQSAAPTSKDSDADFPNKRRNQIFAGIFALIAMVGYALSTGIVEVSVKDDETTEENLEDYEDMFESTED